MRGRFGMACAVVVLAASSATAQSKAATTQKAPARPKAAPAAPPVAEPPKPAAEPPQPAEVEAPAAATPPPPPALAPTRIQDVGDIDMRLMANTDILLLYVEAGVGLDVGVARLGPGVLAVGGEFQVGACVSLCLFVGALTNVTLRNAFYAPHARVSYHFLPKQTRGMEKVDFYGLVFGGITYATTHLYGGTDAGEFDYRGNGVGPALGLGAGGKYFVGDRLFLGAEARLGYSAGTYTYTARFGEATLSDSYSAWTLTGLGVQLFGGLRF